MLESKESTPVPVFVSYAHDNDSHDKNVLDFCDELCFHYIDAHCDQYVEDGNPIHGWPHWMADNIRNSKFVLVVASEKYLLRYEGKEQDGVGLGGKWESVLSQNEIYQNDFKNSKFIPVIFCEADKKLIPDFLQPFTYYNLEKESDRDTLRKRIKGELVNRKPKLGQQAKRPISDKEKLTSHDSKHSTTTLPTLPLFTEDMKPGVKILQAFFVLPVIKRFKIAGDLGLINDGEKYDSPNVDKICGEFLIRAKQRNLLGDLWSKLFNETIDPNPFK